MRTVLTIAGSDSGGGAGIQADLKTFAAHAVHGACAVTAVTAQNTIGVARIHAIPADVVVEQIETVVADIDVAASKTGMLVNREVVEAVASCLRRVRMPLLVIDPVLRSTGGSQLLEQDALQAFKSQLLPQAYCITPNRAEAEILAGRSIESVEDARDAACRIFDLGPRSVVVTGGHLPTDNVIDVLFDGDHHLELAGPRLKGRSTHGTGCTFSAALTAELALGHSLADAVRAAKTYVADAIKRGVPIGAGNGPLRHV